MLAALKEYFIKKVIIKGVIAKVEALLAKLPQNDAKTITGILVVCLGVLLQSIPQTAPYVQPILDYLRTLPASEIVAGGVVWSAVGLFHKTLKWIVKAAGLETAKEKEGDLTNGSI